MQPTPELTVQERPAISHKRNVSRATIKNAVYVGGIFLSVVHVSSMDILIPCNGADVEKIAGIFAQKVGDGGVAQIIINEKWSMPAAALYAKCSNK